MKSQILPLGMDFSTSELANALGKVAEMVTKNPKNTMMAIKAVAFILDGMDKDDAVVQIVDWKMNSVLDTFCSATDAIVKDLVKTVTEQLREMKTQAENITQATQSIKSALDHIPAPTELPTAYRDAILKEIRALQVDLCVQAQELAKNHQFLFDIEGDDLPMWLMSNNKLLRKLNNVIKEVEHNTPHRVCMAQCYTNCGVMFEMCMDEGLRWLKDKENVMGPLISPTLRLHS